MSSVRAPTTTASPFDPAAAYSNLDPPVVPSPAVARGPFVFLPRQHLDKENALDYLGSTVFIYFTVYGLGFLAVGILAIVLPIALSSISVQHMVAWLLVLTGVFALLHFFLVFGAPGTLSLLLVSILHLTIAIWCLSQPPVRRGSTFVWITSSWFVLHGLLKLLMGYELRGFRTWPAMVFAGSLGIVLGIVNIAMTPSHGFGLLGIFVGIDFTISSFALLLIALVAYQVASRFSSRNESLLGSM